MGFTSEEAALLLRNKFVVVLGDSIQRAVYKDLVLFLQKANLLTDAQLRRKCEASFEGDSLVEAGQLTNSTDFRETRQFVQPFHMLKFHFLTRVYSGYVESILTGFQNGISPDILIINSCVWDISRYGADSKKAYLNNLSQLFQRLREVLRPHCLVIWSLAMPLGARIKGGFLPPELQTKALSLRADVIEANFHGAWLASANGHDVLDLHFHFRLRLPHRATDGIHWNQLAHRHITQLLLRHIAEAWGVSEPQGRTPGPSGMRACPYPRYPMDRQVFDHRWRLLHHRLVLRRRVSHHQDQEPYARHSRQRGHHRPGGYGFTGY